MSRTRARLPFTACVALLAACSCTRSTAPAGGTPKVACADGVKGEGEADVDCGGPCAPCADGKTCGFATDCASGVCDAGRCAVPSCTDGVQNGGETAVDCGGATCPACGSGVGCTSGTQCATGVCLDGSCDCGDGTGVYVSATTGDDANGGTPAAPLRTIQAAVACAVKVPREIRVAEGVYEGSRSSAILLVEGKSLMGGWSPDFSVRIPADHRTEIRDTTDVGAAGTGVAVLLSSTSTATVLDGFTIQASTLGTGSTAISATAIGVAPGQLAGGTVRNDDIRCGGNADVLFSRCIDLGTSGGNILVENDAIHLGTSDPNVGTSWGIHGYGVSSVVVRGNVFDGGSSAAVLPIDLWVAPSASPLVEANDVRPGTGGDAGIRLQLMSAAATPAVRNNVVVVTGGAVAIDDASAAEISNNTIVAASGIGIRTSISGAAVQNNAIATDPAGTCLEDATTTAGPYSVHDNDLFGCAAPWVNVGGPPPLSLDEVNALPGASGNISGDPLLDPASGYRPLAGSPLLGNGVDLSSLFQTDKTGAIRTGSWSIGAYQAP